MAIIGEGISHRGLEIEEFHWPFNLTGDISAADVGKAVTLDAANPRSVKLAGAGEEIIGYLVSYENRTVEGVVVGTVACKGGHSFEAPDAHGIVVGDSVTGSATPGLVAARMNSGATDKEPNYSVNMVTAVNGNVIEVLIK